MIEGAKRAVAVVTLSAAMTLGPAARAGLDGFKGPGGGWAIATFSSDDCSLVVAMEFKRTDGPGSGSFNARVSPITHSDLPEGATRGTVLVRRLPAGHYRITRLHVQDPCSRLPAKQDDDPHKEFDIQEGRTIYLGELHFQEIYGGETRGVTGFNGWRLEVRDSSSRDLAIARRKVPDMGSASVPPGQRDGASQ